MSVNHAELPFDELQERIIRPGDFDNLTGVRVMQDGWHIGTWIPVGHDGIDPVARKILAVNDLLAALEFIVNDVPAPGEDAELTAVGYNMACAAIAKARGE